MELYLLRHGIAVERTVGLKDRERPLTSKGRKKIERLAATLDKLDVSFDAIVSSPFARARETAEIIAKHLHIKGELFFSGNLQPEGDPKSFIQELIDKPIKAAHLLVVGHEPHLSSLASYLIAGKPGLGLDLKKGGLCKLQLEALTNKHGATLLWLVPPKLLGA